MFREEPASWTACQSTSCSYQTPTLIYDAMLRTRQTQSMTPQCGRVVTDTFYDSRDWARMKYNSWWDPATTPNTTLVTPSALNPAAQVYDQEEYVYDGLGRGGHHQERAERCGSLPQHHCLQS